MILYLCKPSLKIMYNLTNSQMKESHIILQNKDNKKRCFGGKIGKDLYAEYHDYEWGVPSHNDQHLFEMIILEGAQAGLNWETILKKREGYQNAFYHFDVRKVAAMTDGELKKLCQNPEIIRNRLKIYSVKKNAQVFLKIQKEYDSFATYLWRYVNGKPIVNNWKKPENVPTKSKESKALSKDLQKRGMSFVGPTIMYAYMQAVGLINDHLTSCWLYSDI